ncbi:hypothetical protein [Paenibacillus alba]|nr:hypothetical protein [Paenibacillus alba]
MDFPKLVIVRLKNSPKVVGKLEMTSVRLKNRLIGGERHEFSMEV